ncbi:MAG: hypothetical protein M1818_000346 [Claussenomyces sp. TS43310]|nr:MAG: hypothetical protein M1818_000346 [Claussenomyces sp. TS43310]
MKAAELRRHGGRASYELDAVAEVFADSFLAHVSFVDGGRPQCLPMIAVVAAIEGAAPAVYLHGHPSARLMELVRAREGMRRARGEDGDAGAGEVTHVEGPNDKVKEEAQGEPKGHENLDDDEGKDDDRFPIPGDQEIRLTNAWATPCAARCNTVDALVLSSAPNGHTFNYRSAVIHGACTPVIDAGAKREVMRRVTDHIMAGRWDDVNPISSARLALVQIIRVDILALSLKHRTSIPVIQPRNPEKDGPDREEPVWTGVVPLHEVLEQPIPSGLTDDAVVPKGLLVFIETRNERHLKSSMSSVR